MNRIDQSHDIFEQFHYKTNPEGCEEDNHYETMNSYSGMILEIFFDILSCFLIKKKFRIKNKLEYLCRLYFYLCQDKKSDRNSLSSNDSGYSLSKEVIYFVIFFV